ncbi:putative ABC transport system permease protein [Tenacibaculum sp. 190524A05c]|uniref:ABC transport system permease protein n=2 Tax=Tenacibaculum platacis TaxID=3137852 RepID=A0ABP1EVW3_9FLAO
MMNVWKISLENIKSKSLYTFLSVFTLALSIALLLGIQQLKSSFKYQTENNLGGIDLVLGAKGSPLQLVLASILHMDDPTGNIKYSEAKKVAKNRMIKTAVPISYGDNFKGYRIVGTTNEFLSLYDAKVSYGKGVEKSLDAVIGATVAEKLGLSVGDTFLSSHGLVENDIDVHDDKFTVVGILEPTYKVIDRLIVTKLESIWDVHAHHDHEEESHSEHKNDEKHDDHAEEHHADEHHDHEDHDHDKNDSHGNHEEHADEHHNHDKHKNHKEHADEHHDHDKHEGHENHEEHHDHEEHNENREITSLLISFKTPRALLTLPRRINDQTNMQAALPKFELDKLYSYTGIGFKTITWIAYLILLISGMIIFISLYKMVKERSFDLALLRTFGASNFQLIKLVSYEGLMIVLSAFALGFGLIKILLHFLFQYMQTDYLKGVLQPLSFNEIVPTAVLVLIIIFVSIAVAIYPILKMKVSTILSNEK